MDKAKEWKAFGDVNPLEHGGEWVREDEDCYGDFHVRRWIPSEEEEGRGTYCHGIVTPTDDWIERDEVFSYAGLYSGSPIERIVVEVFNYYSADNFSGREEEMSVAEVKEQLKIEGIEV